MSGKTKIVGLAGESSQDDELQAISSTISPDAESLVLTGDMLDEYVTTDEHLYYDEDVVPNAPWTRFVIPTLLAAAFFGWTGFFVWTYLPEFTSLPANARIVELIATWSVPTLLIGVLWLLALRNSTAEASRFSKTAGMLRNESEALERRMRTVNEEITLAREFLAQNARELESVGRQSAKKLVEAAEQLSSALTESDEKAKTLETVSNAATSNLDMLRKHLPVVISAAKDATNQIGTAGNSAQLQVAAMTASLEQLGNAADVAAQNAEDMAQKSSESSDRLNAMLHESAERLEQTTSNAEERTASMASSLHEAADLATAKLTEMGGAIEAQIIDSGEKLSTQIAAFEVAISAIAEQSASDEARIASMIDNISSHIETSAARVSALDGSATEGTARLAFAISAVNDSTVKLGDTLSRNGEKAETLIERSERLLLSLETANREIEETLPAAMKRTSERFTASLVHLDDMKAGADAIGAYSDDLLSKVSSLEHLIAAQQNSVATLMSESDAQFATRHEQADALAGALLQTRNLLEEMNDTASERLVSSLLRVRETTRQAAESSKKILDEELSSIADRLSEQNKTLLSEAVDSQIAAMGEVMQQSIDRHITQSESATERMTAQLTQIDEMTHNLEQRVAETRSSFDGIDDDSFARRMALLTESLNSTAIDVAKIMSNEVTDTAWAAYLKGDRGVFTRRAVRLLDAGEARIIVGHYDEDTEFREHVNRYIHDFESMMRILLSTRDGNAIGVTLLSSDVGKLYVALAQAIERLRN